MPKLLEKLMSVSSDSIVKSSAALSCALICIAFILGVCYGNPDGWRLFAMAGICIFSIGGALSVLDGDKDNGKPKG